jgi:hypothetical protein
MLRTFIAGIAGGKAMNLAMLVTFGPIGFGWNGGGILLTSPSRKHLNATNDAPGGIRAPNADTQIQGTSSPFRWKKTLQG